MGTQHRISAVIGFVGAILGAAAVFGGVLFWSGSLASTVERNTSIIGCHTADIAGIKIDVATIQTGYAFMQKDIDRMLQMQEMQMKVSKENNAILKKNGGSK